ncbi:MAG: hypothetical protein NXH70_02010 [Hyphomonas sp.]|nr:hypothetical protein [Hyphomonas sp.]
MFGIIYADKKIDALEAVILVEVISAEISSKNQNGLTPAVLARAHNLSPETARRRLISLMGAGWVVQRNGQYFLTDDSSCRENFDKIVLEFEKFGSAALI